MVSIYHTRQTKACYKCIRLVTSGQDAVKCKKFNWEKITHTNLKLGGELKFELIATAKKCKYFVGEEGELYRN